MRLGSALQLALLSSRFLDGEGDPSGNGTATLAPPAAPAAPPAPPAEREPLHPQEDRLTPVQRMAAELRDKITKGEVGFAPDPAAPAPDAPTPPAQPAATEGTPPAEAAGSSESGTPPAGEPPAEGAADDELLTIELPARRGQEPIALQVPDRETAEALRHMRNRAHQAEQLLSQRDEIAQSKAELAAFQHHAQVDPVGLVLEYMRPEHRTTLAEHLLAQPGVLEAVLERVENWQGNPDARRADAAEMDRDRTIKSGEVQRQMQAHAFNQRVLNVVTETVDRLAALAPADVAEGFRDDALGDIAKHFRGQPPRGLPTPEQLAGVIAQRCRLYGVSPDRAAAALLDHQDPSTPPAPRPKGPAAEALANKAQGTQVDGRKLVQAAAARRAVAAAVPGAGVGAGGTRTLPPPKQGLKERFAFVRQAFGLRGGS